MINRKSVICLGLVLCMGFMTSCSHTTEDTKAAKESDATEKEGTGQADLPDTEAAGAEQTALSKGEIALLLAGSAFDETSLREEKEIIGILSDAGYQVCIRYANSDPILQNRQVRSMVIEEAKALILCPTDAYGLTDSLKNAYEAGIPVISCEKLIMGTNALNYHVAFDTRQIGKKIAAEICSRQGLSLENISEEIMGKSATIEFLMDDPYSFEELFLFNGIMEYLEPYFEAGLLECRSGRLTYEKACINQDETSNVAAFLDDLMKSFYPQEKKADIVVTGNDALALEAAAYYEDQGFVPGQILHEEETTEGTTLIQEETQMTTSLKAEDEFPSPVVPAATQLEQSISAFLEEARAVMNGEAQQDWPIITGFGASLDAVQAVKDGKLSVTVFMDERTLGKTAAQVAVRYLEDEDIEVSNYKQYDNGVKIIRTVTCDAQMIDSDNYQLLIDNGYYDFGQVFIYESDRYPEDEKPTETTLLQEETGEIPVSGSMGKTEE